jgi:ornithine cyclodeaminase/alanine dehydrogenase-like protein (mu-crystallin family)
MPAMTTPRTGGGPLYLTEADVDRHLPMEACIEAVADAFRDWAEGRAANRPRVRAPIPGATLHTLSAASAGRGRLAAKVYATTRAGARFVVLLFDAGSSDLLAIIEADRLGQVRTGAASAVATRHLARRDARVLAVLGTGWQARGQARAIACVRRMDRSGEGGGEPGSVPLESVRAWGRDRGRLAAFCREVEAATGVPARPARSAEEAVRGADIVVTATASPRPVLRADWLSPGVHVNAVGSNRPDRRELDPEVIRSAGLVVVDSLEQARLEAGDLLLLEERDAAAAFSRAVELSALVAGRHPGRPSAEAMTVFKSLGIGLEDLAAAEVLYERAAAAGAGRRVP